jgi:glycosyltransferase involved in cell wall biosynthesis
VTAVVDVVIPVRDVDAYLAEALDSVFDQEVDVVVTVVDAGSRTPIRLPDRHAARPDVQLIRREEPMFAGAARTLGVAAGSAPWISFLDADDIWPKGSRRALIDAANSAGGDVALGTMTHFHADAEAAARLKLPEGEQRALIAGGLVLRRSVWENVGPFDPTLRAGEFIDWFNRVTIAGLPIVDVEHPALRRRVHLASTTATQARTDDRADYLEVVRRWMHRNDLLRPQRSLPPRSPSTRGVPGVTPTRLQPPPTSSPGLAGTSTATSTRQASTTPISPASIVTTSLRTTGG